MTLIEKLEEDYNKIKSMDEASQIGETFKFIKELLSDNALQVINFHYSLLNDKKQGKLYNRVRASFKDRPKNIVEPFLLNKLKVEKNIELRADIIQMLGTLKSPQILPYAIKNVTSENRNIRYRCIIIIGWLGNKEDLAVLNERLLNDPDSELRGYAATAMRQIWFKKKASSEDILPYLYLALAKEKSENALSMIIIVIQDILKRKFGLQERIEERKITGDVFKAKEKLIKELGLEND